MLTSRSGLGQRYVGSEWGSLGVHHSIYFTDSLTKRQVSKLLLFK